MLMSSAKLRRREWRVHIFKTSRFFSRSERFIHSLLGNNWSRRCCLEANAERGTSSPPRARETYVENFQNVDRYTKRHLELQLRSSQCSLWSKGAVSVDMTASKEMMIRHDLRKKKESGKQSYHEQDACNCG